MCGIAGILSQSSLSADNDEALHLMQQALRHRGPDDQGIWRSPSGKTAFVHTRLSILDLSAAGHQPMSTTDGRLTLTFNGEIYNFLELRTTLEQEGVTFGTRTDTEVILQLYEKYGEDCLLHLRGMFAFALWDEQEQSCFLARDRFGIKPLYYAQANGRLTFASEARALAAGGLPNRETDPAALALYFQTGSVPEPLAMNRVVRMLEAGHSLRWKNGAVQHRRWWQIAFPAGEEMTVARAAAVTRKALLDTVDHHFISDVPVGIFLSGGVDSTALLALAHATGRRNIQTFSIGVDDPGRDESSLAQRTAKHFGTCHHELKLSADKARELFTRFLDVVDQPTIDGFNTFTVAGLARDNGMKVVLSGLGGDELFAGYPSFEKIPLLHQFSKMLGPFRGLAGIGLAKLRNKPQMVRLGSALADGGSLEQLYDAFRGVFSSADARRLSQHFTGELPKFAMSGQERIEIQSVANKISALELRRYMLNQLLRDSDVMSMAHGLELRVPLVDSALFDAIATIPAALRLRQGKQLLLDAVPEIPDWIRQRPKSGFLFPYEKWLATPEWQGLFADALKNLPVSLTSWYQRWAVFVFSRWLAREETAR